MAKAQVYFYFDSKEVFNKLTSNSSKEFECIDKGDEFACYINVEKENDLKSFFEFLFNTLNKSPEELQELTNEVFDGYGFDEIEPELGEDLANKIIAKAWDYLESLP